MSHKIFAFWESVDQTIPAYLELCKQTWIKNIPDVEIHIINHSNLKDYIGDIYNVEKLKKISLPMQSDIISAAVLEKFGGVFLDLDCIVTNNIFENFEDLPGDKLIGFGYPGKGIHLAVLYAKKENNIILKKWREEAQKKLNNLPESYGWDYFGNSIINPMIKSEEYKNNFLIIDRTESGNILESKVLLNSTWQNSKEYYENFYFNKNIKYNVNVIDFVNCGIISLHNSWSPKEVKGEKVISNFLSLELPICDIFKNILSGNYAENKNNIFLLSILFKEKLIKHGLKNITFRIINNLLVIDYKVNDIFYAFDVSVNVDLINIDFIVRNNATALNKIKELKILGNVVFNANKSRVLSSSNSKDEVFDAMVSILQKIDNLK